MKQLPNLLKQESSAAATYISILLRMYNDPREDRVHSKDDVEKALIPYSLQNVVSYLQVVPRNSGRLCPAGRRTSTTEYYCMETDFGGNFGGICELLGCRRSAPLRERSNKQFSKQIEQMYPACVEIIDRHSSDEVRTALRRFFMRVGEVLLKGKSKA